MSAHARLHSRIGWLCVLSCCFLAGSKRLITAGSLQKELSRQAGGKKNNVCTLVEGKCTSDPTCTCDGLGAHVTRKTHGLGSGEVCYSCDLDVGVRFKNCPTKEPACSKEACVCDTNAVFEQSKTSDGTTCFACNILPDKVQTCYTGGSIGHAYFVLPTNCDKNPNGVLNGCGFSSPFSKYVAIGWGGGQNSGSSQHSSGGGVAGLLSFVPGVRTGSIHQEGAQCENPLNWDVPEVCVRAVINEVAEEFEEHRQWNWTQAALWMGSDDSFRREDCSAGLKTRSDVFAGSWGGISKRAELCWDFVLSVKSLVCDAKSNTKTAASYSGICRHTAQQWQNLEISDQIQQLMDVEAKKPGFLTAQARDALLAARNRLSETKSASLVYQAGRWLKALSA